MSDHRLGDIIDDHCSRCHMLTNHSVVAIVGEEVKKVRCRTCNHEHDYRHGKGGKKKTAKLSAYEQVLASILGGKPGEAAVKPPEPARPVKAPVRPRTRALSPHSRPLHPR